LTTGGWTQSLLDRACGISLQPGPTFSRDLAFVVRRPLVRKFGFAFPLKSKDADAVLNRGGRHLFVAPWRDRTLVGVWHGIFNDPPEEVATSWNELAGFLAEVNAAHPGFNISREDISMVLTGLTLFGDVGQQVNGQMSFGKRSMLVDHAEKHQIKGLVSLVGVRATTARGMAEKAVDLIFRKLVRQRTPSVSSQTPIFGGSFISMKNLKAKIDKHVQDHFCEKVAFALAKNYGSEYQRVLNYVERDLTLLKPIGSSTTLGAEIVHGVNEEMAVTLSDVVFRRTDLGTLGGVSLDQIETCGRIMARELDWSNKRLAKEISLVETHIARCGFVFN